MVKKITKREFVGVSLAGVLGVGLGAGTASAADENTEDAPWVDGAIERFATTARGAEVTGPFVLPNGNPMFSLQHPSRSNPSPYNLGGIGIVQGFDILDEEFDELTAPQTDAEKERVRVAAGEYDIVAQEEDNLANGEDFGVPTTPDGVNVDVFAGSRYTDFGFTPDMNQFVAENPSGRQGYLFTNFESSPGNLTRLPLKLKGGEWEADVADAENLVNAERFRDIGGTRINCYGDLSPWNTPLSAEEDYSHPYVTGAKTVSEMVEAGTGVGYLGGSHFWNRPNPTEIQSALGEVYGDNSWYAQGYWALGGVELLAYHLGADPVDQSGGNDVTPITGDAFPNKYRYGYIVDVRNPTDDDWQPVKYHCMGRYAPESPDVMADERTVYLTSDGSFKGLYKFVADEPIPSYDDPMDVAGTLYVAQVQGPATGAPASATLDVEWLELGSASNREVESWIAQYDDVDQQDYLDLGDGDLEAADRYVAENGNPAYITPDEIVEWAAQYESEGPDGVDEDLRKVPFLETRAAAKEIGATVEWRKAEGIDSRTGEPGDYVYVGFSEVDGSGMSDDAGDLQLERVEGGIVYRAMVEGDYNLSTFEPVVVGPDATDPASVADQALINVDNVAVMDDGRVLLCEDADTLGRSYANDNLWVYTPPEGRVDVDDDRGRDEDDENPGNGRGRDEDDDE